MKKIPIFLGFISILALSGCAVNGEHLYADDGTCLSCWNNPITGEAINHDINNEQDINNQQSTSYDQSQNKHCFERVKFFIDIPIDPDFAPALGIQMDRGFRHVIEPGIRFHMKDAVYLNSKVPRGWLSIELEKSDNQQTRVYANYCIGGLDGFTLADSTILVNNIENGYL